MTRTVARLVLLALLVPVVVSCGHEDPSIGTYVALGDSFTSGAGLAQPVASAGDCAQSRLSYPSLVAKRTGATFVDACWGGASTLNTTADQALASGQSWPPQLDAVTRDTDLVTVGLGYNDDAYYGNALIGCTQAAATNPDGHPCQDLAAAKEDPAAATTRIGDRVRAVLESVHDRAPDAQVLLVGYPQLVPESGTCPELPLAAGDYGYVHHLLELLDESLQKAAHDAGATFVDVYAASRGHDICAGDQAWVNGFETQDERALLFHPYALEQQAVADLVLAALRS
jgi:lysophospholipase L1-like esterase